MITSWKQCATYTIDILAQARFFPMSFQSLFFTLNPFQWMDGWWSWTTDSSSSRRFFSLEFRLSKRSLAFLSLYSLDVRVCGEIKVKFFFLFFAPLFSRSWHLRNAISFKMLFSPCYYSLTLFPFLTWRDFYITCVTILLLRQWEKFQEFSFSILSKSFLL